MKKEAELVMKLFWWKRIKSLKMTIKWQKNFTPISIENKYTIQQNIPSSDPVDKAIMKFQFHPSILLINVK